MNGLNLWEELGKLQRSRYGATAEDRTPDCPEPLDVIDAHRRFREGASVPEAATIAKQPWSQAVLALDLEHNPPTTAELLRHIQEPDLLLKAMAKHVDFHPETRERIAVLLELMDLDSDHVVAFSFDQVDLARFELGRAEEEEEQRYAAAAAAAHVVNIAKGADSSPSAYVPELGQPARLRIDPAHGQTMIDLDRLSDVSEPTVMRIAVITPEGACFLPNIEPGVGRRDIHAEIDHLALAEILRKKGQPLHGKVDIAVAMG